MSAKKYLIESKIPLLQTRRINIFDINLPILNHKFELFSLGRKSVVLYEIPCRDEINLFRTLNKKILVIRENERKSIVTFISAGNKINYTI